MAEHDEIPELVFAVLIGHEMVNVLLEHGANPNVQDENGRTPLMLAVIDEGTGYETIDALLSYGADPDLQDNNGRTALMLAAAGKDGCMEILLPALIRTGGIRVRESASWCAFALAYDAMQRDRQLEVVRRLIACGADVNIRSRSGMGALEYAVVTKDTELLELLMSGSKKDLGAV